MKIIQKKLYQYHLKLPQVQGNQEIFTKQSQQDKFRQYMKIQQNPQHQQQLKQKQQKQQQKQKQQLWKQQFQHGHFKIQYLPPFAKITQVPLHSPAHKSGIFPNDLLSEFSQVNIYTPDNIKHIPYHVRENQQIRIVLLRPLRQEDKEQIKKDKGIKVYKLKDNKQYRKVQVKVIPQKWDGRGLLGCKIDPL